MPLDSSKGESHVIQHNDTSEKTDLSMEKTLENMKGEKDEILNFFKSFDINYSAMSETLGLLVKNDKNKSVNLSHTFFEEIPSYSKELFYYNDKLYLIYTDNSKDDSNRCDLILREIDKNKNINEETLVKNIMFIEPFSSCIGSRLYFSTISLDGKSIFSYYNLDSGEVTSIKESDFNVSDKGVCSGEYVTFISEYQAKPIYQISTYENQSLTTDKPKKNELVFLDENLKDSNSFDIDPIDSFYTIDDMIFTHDRMYDDNKTTIRLYDKNFKEFYKSDDIFINRVIGVKKLKRKDKDYILLKEEGENLILLDYKDNSIYYLAKYIGDTFSYINIIGEDLVFDAGDGKYIKIE